MKDNILHEDSIHENKADTNCIFCLSKIFITEDPGHKTNDRLIQIDIYWANNPYPDFVHSIGRCLLYEIYWNIDKCQPILYVY